VRFTGTTKAADQRAVVLWDDFVELFDDKPVSPKHPFTNAELPALSAFAESSERDREPVGWWKFGEGSGDVLADASKLASHGTIHGAQWTEGPGNMRALAFQPGSYVDFAQPLRLSNAATIMLRVKFDEAIRPNSAKGYPTLVSFGVDGDFSYNVTLGGQTGKLGFGCSVLDDERRRVLDGVRSIRESWDAGRWYHFAVVCDPALRQMITYVDGAPHDTATFRAPIQPGNPKSKLYFGLPAGWGYGHIAPSAALSDVRIFRTALKPEEIAAAFRSAEAK
jgi:hypothetical protein